MKAFNKYPFPRLGKKMVVEDELDMGTGEIVAKATAYDVRKYTRYYDMVDILAKMTPTALQLYNYIACHLRGDFIYLNLEEIAEVLDVCILSIRRAQVLLKKLLVIERKDSHVLWWVNEKYLAYK